jgi:hypothetical protein
MEAMEDDILALIDGGDMPFHYVGGLKKNQCEALLAVDKSRFTPLEGDGLEGQSTYRESGFEAYGQKATAIVVDNPKLREGQVQGVMRDMADASNRLEELSKRLCQIQWGCPQGQGAYRRISHGLGKRHPLQGVHGPCVLVQGDLKETGGERQGEGLPPP